MSLNGTSTTPNTVEAFLQCGGVSTVYGGKIRGLQFLHIVLGDLLADNLITLTCTFTHNFNLLFADE